MAQKTNNPKQAEIELIEKLFAMDGYFAAAFTRADIALMERNINADYDLLCGTSRDQSDEVHGLRDQLDQADQMNQAEINRLRAELKQTIKEKEEANDRAAMRLALANNLKLDLATYQEQLHKTHLQLIALKINHNEKLEDDDMMAILKTIQNTLNKED